MKHLTQVLIRQLHLFLRDGGLPLRIAVCLHELEKESWGSFREMVQFFQGQGYRFVDPLTFCLSSTEPLFLLSFDDNYRSWYEALPLFDALGIRGTFYLNSLPLRDRVSDSDYRAFCRRINNWRLPLSQEELKSLAAEGHVIGGHTHSHVNLTALPFEEAKEEIRMGKASLEEILEKTVEHFSYPYGMRRFFSEDLRAYCREIGFQTVANAIPAMLHAPQLPLAIQRTNWDIQGELAYNLANLRVDGRFFERHTGRSAVG